MVQYLGVSVLKKFQGARSITGYIGRDREAESKVYDLGTGAKQLEQCAIHAAREQHRGHNSSIGSKGAF